MIFNFMLNNKGFQDVGKVQFAKVILGVAARIDGHHVDVMDYADAIRQQKSILEKIGCAPDKESILAEYEKSDFTNSIDIHFGLCRADEEAALINDAAVYVSTSIGPVWVSDLAEGVPIGIWDKGKLVDDLKRFRHEYVVEPWVAQILAHLDDIER